MRALRRDKEGASLEHATADFDRGAIGLDAFAVAVDAASAVEGVADTPAYQTAFNALRSGRKRAQREAERAAKE